MKNELINNKSELYIETIGLNTLIVLSTILFPSNEDIKSYTEENIKTELKDYLFSSRTLLVARINRYIYDLEVEELIKLNKQLNDYLINIGNKYNEKVKEGTNNKFEKGNVNIKRNKSKDNLKTWLKNI